MRDKKLVLKAGFQILFHNKETLIGSVAATKGKDIELSYEYLEQLKEYFFAYSTEDGFFQWIATKYDILEIGDVYKNV